MWPMYTITITILFILGLIYIFLRKEEKRVKDGLTYGLASKFWILKERRRFVRFDQDIKIKYNLLNKTHEPYYSKTSNISSRGVCIVTFERMKDKGYIDLEMDIPNTPKPIKLIGQVMWTKDLQTQDKDGRRLFFAGIRFTKIDPKSEALIISHLKTLKRD